MKIDYDSNTPFDLEWMKFNVNFKRDEQNIKGFHVGWGTLILKPYISSLVKKIPKNTTITKNQIDLWNVFEREINHEEISQSH